MSKRSKRGLKWDHTFDGRGNLENRPTISDHFWYWITSIYSKIKIKKKRKDILARKEKLVVSSIYNIKGSFNLQPANYSPRKLLCHD